MGLSSNRFPTLTATCRDFNQPSVDPFGVDPVFSRSSSLFGGVDLENNIGKYYNISELPVSGVPNGFSVRSSDLEQGRNGFSVFIDIMSSNKQANRIVSYMREGNFIDTSTKSIVVKFATFNPLLVRFTIRKFSSNIRKAAAEGTQVARPYHGGVRRHSGLPSSCRGNCRVVLDYCHCARCIGRFSDTKALGRCRSHANYATQKVVLRP